MARSFIANFLVKVGSTNLGKTKIDIDGLSASVDRATLASQKNNKASQDQFSTQAKGVIGTANSTKSFSKLSQTIGNGNGGLVGAYATLAANVFAATAAFNALRSAAQVEQITAGLGALGDRTGLNLSIAANAVKEISGYTLSTEQALRSTAQVMSAGFGRAELEQITKVSRDVSVALGRNMTDSMDRLTRGIIKLEPELLDELGLMTRLQQATDIYAQQTGKAAGALSVTEKRQAFLNAVLAEGEAKFNGLSDAAGDSTKYDKLAATLADLQKTTMSWVDTLISVPLSFVTANVGTLMGAIILLASSLKSQLLPGFMNLSKGAVAASVELQTSAVAGITKLSEGLYDSSHSAKQWAEEIKAGTATAGQYSSALKEVQTDIEGLTNDVKSGAVTGADAEEWQTQIDKLKEIETGMIAYGQSTQRAAAEAQAGAAIQQAATGSISAGFGQLRGAVGMYNTSLAGATATTRIFSTAVFAATRGLQFFGAMFLRAIPIIGQVVMAFGLLTAAYDWLMDKFIRPKGFDAFVKASEDLSSTLAKNTQYTEAYNKSVEASVPAHVRSTQSLTILSNSVKESIELMEKAIATREKMNTPNEQGRPWYEGAIAGVAALGGEFEQLSKWYFKISDTSKFAGFKELGQDVTNSAELQTMMKMANSGILEERQALDRELKARGLTLQSLLSMGREDETKMLATIRSATKKAGEGIGGITPELENVKSAFDDVEKATQDFARSSIPTSKWDKMSDTMFNAVMATNSLARKLEEAGVSGENLGDVLSQVGSTTAAFMGPNLQVALKGLTELDVAIQKLKEGGVNKNEQGQVNNLLAQRAAASRTLARMITEAVEVQDKRLWQLRTESILMEGQIKLQSARLNGLKTMFARNGQGLLEQFEAEEKIRDMQISQIETEIQFNKVHLQSLNTKISSLEITKQTTMEARKQLAIEEAMIRLQDLKNFAALQAKPGEAPAPISEQSMQRWRDDFSTRYQKVLDDAAPADQALDDSIRTARREAQKYELGIVGLQQQQALIREENLTLGQKMAAAAQKDYELSQEYLENYKKVSEITRDTVAAQDKIRGFAEGTTGSLTSQVTQMQIQNRTLRDNLLVDHRNRVEGLLYQKAIIKAERDRGGAALKSGDLALEANAAQIQNLDVILQAEAKRLEIVERAALIEMATFDTRKEGLQWQQDALAYRQREVDLTNELYTQIVKNNQEREKTSMMQRNVAMTPDFNKAQEIEARIEAYRLAVSESKLRESMIDLEFTLLDAQREMLKWELQEKWAMLKIAKVPDSDPHMKQLTSIISSLATAPSGRDMAEIQKRISRETLEGQREQLRQDMVVGNPMLEGLNDLTSEVIGMARLNSARANIPVVDSFKAREIGVAIAAETGNNKLDVEVPAINTKLADTLAVSQSAVTHLASIDTNVAQLVTNSGQGAVSTAVGSASFAGATADQIWEALKKQESGNQQFKNGKVVTSHAGAIGIAQIMPQYARDFAKLAGVEYSAERLRNDAAYNEKLGRAFFDSLMRQFPNDTDRAVTAYNAGAGRVRQQGSGANWKSTLPYAEQREYSNKVAARLTGTRTQPAPAPAAALTTPAVNDNTPAPAANQNPTVTAADKAEILKGGEAAEKFGRNVLSISQATGKSIQEVIASFQVLGSTISAFPEPPDLAAMFPLTMLQNLQVISGFVDKMGAGLRALGPEGEAVAAFASGMAKTAELGYRAFEIISSSTASTEKKVAAGAMAISSAITTVADMLNANSAAKIAMIDKEIAAEQKRDGKSAESVAKIESLERKKDTAARKAFNMNKKLQMANAVVSTAGAVANALSTPLPWPMPAILAGIAGAMGAAQLAIIAGSSYQSSASSSSKTNTAPPSTMSIGKRGDSVDLARNNPNAGGEVGYLRGARGQGRNASNYSVIGSAYGGPLPRGYGNTAFAVGENGPEIMTPDNPITVRPLGDVNQNANPQPVQFNIQALDASGVQQILMDQRGNIIGMLREAANANGQTFLEDVNVNVYTSPRTSRL